MNYFKKMRIRYHLMIWYSLLSILVLCAAGWSIYSIVREMEEKRISRQLSGANNGITRMIETTALVTVREHLRVTAEKNRDILENIHQEQLNGEITMAQARQKAEGILLSQRLGESGYIYVIDSDGTLPVHPRPGMRGINISDHWLARDQVLRKNGYLEYEWQNPTESRPRRKALYMIYFQPWDWIISVTCYRDEFKSLLHVEDFIAGIDSYHTGTSGHSFIVSGDGRLLVDPTAAVEQILPAELIGRIASLKNGRLVIPQGHGPAAGYPQRLVNFQYMEQFDWVIASSIDLDEETKPFDRLRLILFLAPVLALLLILPLSLSVGAMITRPLTLLTRKMSEGTAGEFDISADERAPGEVGLLARHFNHYLKRLKATHRELHSEISDRTKAEHQLKLFAKVFEHALEGITITDAEGTIIAVNNAFVAITGYSEAEAIGQNPRILKSDRHDAQFYRQMWHSLLEQGSWVGEIWNRRKNGEAFPEILSISSICDGTGTVTHYVAVFHDITERKLKEEQIHYQAYHDALTGLPNRSLAHDRLEMAMLHARRGAGKVGLFFLDLDHFKNVNDSLGHASGDKLLVQVAGRLSRIVRQEDTVARLGGDEFLIIAADITSENQLLELAGRLVGCLAQPFEIDGQELHITCSIGITLFPEDGDGISVLTRNADVAMYQAKQQGRNTFSLFTPEMSRRVMRRLELETDMRSALKEKQFCVYYQPKVCPSTNVVTGLEALVRWRQPDGGMISPADFIPLAEETGLIVPLGEFVLEDACRTVKLLELQGFRQLRVAVNLSAVQFRQADLVDRLLAILSSNEVEPSRIELEITETTMMTDLQDSIAKLNLLVREGITISIDDFGTGYSSLYYLKNLPINTIKIDRTFIMDVSVNRDDAQIVETIIMMAKNLGISVVAEGVETADQLRLLSQFGCSQIQGFFYSRPLPLDELLAGASAGNEPASPEHARLWRIEPKK